MTENQNYAINQLRRACDYMAWACDYIARARLSLGRIKSLDIKVIDPDNTDAYQASITEARRNLKAPLYDMENIYEALIDKANPAKASDDSSAKRETA